MYPAGAGPLLVPLLRLPAEVEGLPLSLAEVQRLALSGCTFGEERPLLPATDPALEVDPVVAAVWTALEAGTEVIEGQAAVILHHGGDESVDIVMVVALLPPLAAWPHLQVGDHVPARGGRLVGQLLVRLAAASDPRDRGRRGHR